MNIKDIIEMDKDFLTPVEVAGVIGCSPQLIREQVAQHPELIPFHFCKFGNRIKIPRLAFISWMTNNNNYLNEIKSIEIDKSKFNTRFPNDIIIFDDHAEIVLCDKEGNDLAHALIDLDDVDKCKKYRWHLSQRGYVRTMNVDTHIALHRYIMDYFDDELCIDHINHNIFDNRKCNLRIVTYSENSVNRIHKEESGMYYDNKKCRWIVEFWRNHKKYYVGSYNTKGEALSAKKQFLIDNGFES